MDFNLYITDSRDNSSHEMGKKHTFHYPLLVAREWAEQVHGKIVVTERAHRQVDNWSHWTTSLGRWP